MGQSWSSSGEHVPECEPIVEMVAPLPIGVASRAEMRLNANTRYPEAANKVKDTLWESVWGIFGWTKPAMDDSLRLVKNVSRNASIVLVKETGGFKKRVAEAVKKARHRLIPGASGKILDGWLIRHIVEDVELMEVTTKTDTVVFAPGLRGINKVPMFQVDIVITKRVLEKASGYRTLLGIGITVSEVMPARPGPFSLARYWNEDRLDAWTYTRDVKDHGPPRPPRRVETAVVADMDAPIARSTRSRKRTAAGEVKGQEAAKKGSRVETPAETSGRPAKKLKLKPTSQQRQPTAAQRARQQQQQQQQQAHMAAVTTTSSTARSRRPNAQWTDDERRLLVHFYRAHVKAERMSWRRAAEVWCATFGRSDTGVQLEGNRRHWEKKGFAPDASRCTLCQQAEAVEDDEDEEMEVEEVEEEKPKVAKKGGRKRKREAEPEEAEPEEEEEKAEKKAVKKVKRAKKEEKVEEEEDTTGLRRSKRIRVATFKTRQQ